jgi:hypothetical protein
MSFLSIPDNACPIICVIGGGESIYNVCCGVGFKNET